MLLYVQVKDVETMISLVLFPPFHHPHRTYSCVSKQYLIVHIDQFLLLLLPCTWLYIFNQEKQNPIKMSSLSSGLFPTEVPDNINTQQFCLGASFRVKKTPFHPQPTCGAFTASLQSVLGLDTHTSPESDWQHRDVGWLRTELAAMDQDQSVKIVLITNLKTGRN